MYRFDAELWRWRADAAWHFITVPEAISDEIEARTEAITQGFGKRGFGSVRVRAMAGSTIWTTSLFPSKELAAYILPVKRAVRAAEHLHEGAIATFDVELLDVPG